MPFVRTFGFIVCFLWVSVPCAMAIDSLISIDVSIVPIDGGYDFAGKTHTGLASLTIIWTSGKSKYTHTLSSYDPRTGAFVYHARKKWKNFRKGANRYTFIAKYPDGSEQLFVLPLSTTAKIPYRRYVQNTRTTEGSAFLQGFDALLATPKRAETKKTLNAYIGVPCLSHFVMSADICDTWLAYRTRTGAVMALVREGSGAYRIDTIEVGERRIISTRRSIDIPRYSGRNEGISDLLVRLRKDFRYAKYP